MPSILIYEPQADGRMELVAVENLVFAAAWRAAGHTEPPTFHGVPYDSMVDDPATAVDEAHMFEPHFDRHVWIVAKSEWCLHAVQPCRELRVPSGTARTSGHAHGAVILSDSESIAACAHGAIGTFCIRTPHHCVLESARLSNGNLRKVGIGLVPEFVVSHFLSGCLVSCPSRGVSHVGTERLRITARPGRVSCGPATCHASCSGV